MTEEAAHTRFEPAFAAHRGSSLPGLIPYVTAGFPRLDSTAPLLAVLERAGALAAEVGIPFSDPLADGPTVQRTSWRALENGVTPSIALNAVRDARAMGVALPIALMTYVNPVLAYGVERFAHDAHEAGADGVIVPDLPVDESAELRLTLTRAGLVLIPLVAPTTPPARIARITHGAGGFIYCVSVTGVTGARDALAPEALRLLDAVRSVTPLPRALGFGVSRHEHLTGLAGRAEAAVVGSALLTAIESRADEPEAAASDFIEGMLGTRAAL